MTNPIISTQELDQKVKLYLLYYISADSYQASEPVTVADKIAFLEPVFRRQKHWYIARVDRVKAMDDWLRGMPNALSIEVWYDEIEKIGREWGALNDNSDEVTVAHWRADWFQLLAIKTIELFGGHNVPSDDQLNQYINEQQEVTNHE